ncbi:protein TBATA isoform X42 [Canis lupus familiaris]|uniref:protein TBATA isoform X42 n=1 Tax=Canis lupus familiaris TaxID=9615 RepID=UPI0018F4F1EE|nr:protein TBATA isoform X42 [Canis lupus familiaris]
MGLGFQMACPQACSIKSTMATDVKTQLAEHPLMSPRCLRGQWRTAQKTQGPGQRNPQRAPRPLLSISRAHLFSRGPPFSQGHREKGMQTASSPRAELKPEKKSGHRPRSHGDNGPQKELMIPGIVDFQLIQTALKTPKPQTPGAYRFGRLSHHSFFSRHHPHPQRVTHIQDLTGKPVCVVRDEFSVAPLPQATLLSRCLMGLPTISVPIGDPQSNREPRLSSGLSMPGTTGKAGGPRVSAGNVFPEAWKKELRDLASRVAVFTKENELKSKEKEEPQREQGAKYSAETGRLIPTSTRVIGRRHSRQGPRMYSSGKDEGVQTVFLKDHELLGGLILPGIRFSGPVGRGPRAGLQGLHLLPRVPTPGNRSHSHRQQPGLGSPRSPSCYTELELPPMIRDWRLQGKEGPAVAEMPEAEEAAEGEAFMLLGGMEPHAGSSAASASPDPQPARWDLPTSVLVSPDPGSSRVGRPVGSLKPPRQGPRDPGLGPGAPLSDPADRLPERYPVLATLRSPKRERPGPGTPANSRGSAISTAPSLYPVGKTSPSAPGIPRAISREETAALQPIPEEDEDPTTTQRRPTRVHRESTNSPDASEPEHRRQKFKAKGRMRSLSPFGHLAQELSPGSGLLPVHPPQQQHRLSYHTEPIKRLPSP